MASLGAAGAGRRRRSPCWRRRRPPIPIGTLQAQADRLAAQISSGTERVGTLTRQYNLAAEKQAAAASQLASAQSQLDQTRRSIGAAQDVLRQAAITAYIGQGTAASATSTVGGLAMDLVLRRQYLQVADGNLADGLDRFQAGVRDLQVQEATLRQDQMAASSAAARVSVARQGALAAAAQAEGDLAQVHGQLAQLVVQAEAAKAAQAAKVAEVARPRPHPRGFRSKGACRRPLPVPSRRLPLRPLRHRWSPRRHS